MWAIGMKMLQMKKNPDDHEITVDNPGNNLAANEIMVIVKTLQSWFNERTG